MFEVGKKYKQKDVQAIFIPRYSGEAHCFGVYGTLGCRDDQYTEMALPHRYHARGDYTEYKKPRKAVGWVNVYNGGSDKLLFGKVFDDEKSAKDQKLCACHNYITTMKIEYTEE